MMTGFQSCKKKGATISSSYGGRKSHNHGRACLHCHITGGDNNYWWTVAGSVYKPDLTTPNHNATVYFYNGYSPAGALVKTLAVDGYGNFFTTEAINFADSLYVGIQSASGTVLYMPSAIKDGNCNNCHDGKTNNRIWIN